MALSQNDLLEIWRHYLPESYTIPLEDEADGRGIDVIASISSVLARVAAATEITTQAMYLFQHSDQTADPSSGGNQSIGNLTIFRAAPTDGDLELYEGDELLAEIHTQDDEVVFKIGLELSADITLTEGDSGPIAATINSIRDGFNNNIQDTQGRTIAFKRRIVLTLEDADSTIANEITDSGAFDQFDESMIGAFVRFTAGPNALTYPRRILTYDDATSTVTVDGAALIAGVGNNDLIVVDVNDLGVTAELDGDMADGTHAWLDAIGSERNIGRNAGESDDAYRERVRQLPDIVAPNSLYRACSRILTPLGLDFLFLESRRIEHVMGFFADNDPCDDPVAAIENGGRVLLGDGFQVRGFFVVVEWDGTGEFGMPCDYARPNGVYPDNAVDWGFCDGYAITWWMNLLALIAEIEKTRAAGVPWLLIIVETIP